MGSGAGLLWAAGITEAGALLAVLLTWWLGRKSSTATAAGAAAQARLDFEQLDARREAERERDRLDDKDEILRARTEVERLRAEVADRDARIYQLLGGGRNV